MDPGALDGDRDMGAAHGRVGNLQVAATAAADDRGAGQAPDVTGIGAAGHIEADHRLRRPAPATDLEPELSTMEQRGQAEAHGGVDRFAVDEESADRAAAQQCELLDQLASRAHAVELDDEIPTARGRRLKHGDRHLHARHGKSPRRQPFRLIHSSPRDKSREKLLFNEAAIAFIRHRANAR